ncbi:uncharacterized protein LOC141653314 [Silene latifolia]|uniref:uncharacterized protein LOC141653314 n=1 Tax=Silene latifolia TaxID=37657 RepID=UPI003D776E0C
MYSSKEEGMMNLNETDNGNEANASNLQATENDNAGEATTTTLKEQQNLSLMRAYLESRDPSCKEVDDLTLRRFLRARNLDVEKAALFFLKYQNWRNSFVPKGYISEAEIQYDLAHKKVFLGGLDKKKRPVAVLVGSRHTQNRKTGGLDEFKRFCVYIIDKAIASIPDGQEKFVVIGDLKGFGYSNSDIRGFLGAFSILQDCYPERLGKLFLVNAPKAFMLMWKMIYPFIDNNTKTKIEFVDSKQLKSTLLEIMEESQLPDVYGGTLPLTPIQDA